MKLDRLSVAPLLWFLFASFAAAQDAAPPAHLVHDWSTRHLIFSGLTPENLAASVAADPRAWHSWVRHRRHKFEPSTFTPQFEDHEQSHRHRRRIAADWQMSIGSGVGPRIFPAKFSFDVNAAPDCANDFVVFPTSNTPVPGAGGSGVAATLTAYNNLYTGPGPTGICPTPLAPATQPSVLFAYNTATTSFGKADLSPVLSLDGKEVAFVESNDGSGSNYTAFHVLTWKAGEGTSSGAVVPGNCSAGNSCLTTLVLSNTRSDSRSSPFMDYGNDIAYVGDDGGRLHKITPVFNGTPAEVIGSGWPVQLAIAGQIQSPVSDSTSGHVFATDNTGHLYVVNAATGAVVTTISLGNTPSDPTVDTTNQTVFVFFSDSTLHLSVAQFSTAGTLLRKISVGMLGGSMNVFTGTVDNNYYSNPSTGLLYFAGSVNNVASVYSVGFTGTTMDATASGPLVLTTSSVTSEATPLTEIFNPTFSSAKDRLFVGIDANCATGSADGCIESLDISSGLPSGILNSYPLGTAGSSSSVSGIIVDNVSSTAQASSIYFESIPVSSSESAIKLTQIGLQ